MIKTMCIELENIFFQFLHLTHKNRNIQAHWIVSILEVSTSF